MGRLSMARQAWPKVPTTGRGENCRKVQEMSKTEKKRKMRLLTICNGVLMVHNIRFLWKIGGEMIVHAGTFFGLFSFVGSVSCFAEFLRRRALGPFRLPANCNELTDSTSENGLYLLLDAKGNCRKPLVHHGYQNPRTLPGQRSPQRSFNNHHKPRIKSTKSQNADHPSQDQAPSVQRELISNFNPPAGTKNVRPLKLPGVWLHDISLGVSWQSVVMLGKWEHGKLWCIQRKDMAW